MVSLFWCMWISRDSPIRHWDHNWGSGRRSIPPAEYMLSLRGVLTPDLQGNTAGGHLFCMVFPFRWWAGSLDPHGVCDLSVKGSEAHFSWFMLVYMLVPNVWMSYTVLSTAGSRKNHQTYTTCIHIHTNMHAHLHTMRTHAHTLSIPPPPAHCRCPLLFHTQTISL